MDLDIETHEFKTEKGEFVVVELPKEVKSVTKNKTYQKFITFRYYRCVNHKPKI